MIETREQYEGIKTIIGNLHLHADREELSESASKSLTVLIAMQEIIEALRKALRIADQMDMMMVRHVQDTEAWPLVYQIVEAYREYTNALPDWMAEDG